MDSSPQRVYNDRYELTQHIARGGMAEVYRAQDRLLGRPVALKVLFPELSVDRSFVERFRREAQAAANLSHPNIVPVFDWGEDQGTYFIVMEYVDGRPLSSVLRSSGSMQAERIASIGADVAAALSYAHRHGVVHRDIKPGNILLTDDGMVKVTDFGIARAVNTEESLTQTGAVMGTATYFSPEQAQGYGVDGRSDIYSLGVVLYEMATGRPPFVGETPVAVASKHVRESPRAPRELNPGIPLALEAVIARAMAKEPEQRYQSAQELQSDLRSIAHGHSEVPAGALATSVVAATPAAAVTGVVPGFGGSPGTAATQVLGASGAPATEVMGAQGAGATQMYPAHAPDAGAGGGPGQGPPENNFDAHKERRRTGIYVGILFVLLVALALVVFFLGRSLGYFSSASTSFALPSVVGSNQQKATSLLQGRGLKVQVNTEQNNAAPNTVFATHPGAGSTVSPGDTVTLDVSTGPPGSTNITVPNVLYQSETDAANKLEGLGLQVQIQQQSSKAYPPGTVIGQSPPAGSKIAKNGTVVLSVAEAPTTPTTTNVTVPNVVGDTPVQAGAALGTAGFTTGTTTTQPSSTIGKGLVSSTDPPIGSSQPPGTTINLIVSSGPAQVTVQNVVGLTKSTAQGALTAQNLSVVVNCVTTLNPSEVGLVVSQSPSGGTVVDAGATVTIDVGTSSTSPSGSC